MRTLPLCFALVMLAAVATPGFTADIHPDDAAVLEDIFTEADAVLAKLSQPVPALERKTGPIRNIYAMEVQRSGTNDFVRVGVDEQGRITQLHGNGAWLPNSVFPMLAKLPELRSIRCDHNIVMATRRTDSSYDASGLSHLADSKLEELVIGHGLTDDGVRAIARIQSLKRLAMVHAMGGSAEAVSALKDHPSLESVTFALGPEKTTKEICQVLATIPNLHEIGLHETYMTYENALEHLKPLAGKLKKVTFHSTLVLPNDIEKFRADHPGLEVPEANMNALFRAVGRQNQIKKVASPEAIAYLETLLTHAAQP